MPEPSFDRAVHGLGQRSICISLVTLQWFQHQAVENGKNQTKQDISLTQVTASMLVKFVSKVILLFVMIWLDLVGRSI
jgi:hypothetical protein